MGSHPINLAIRFIIELCALSSVAVWGWKNGEGWLKYFFAIGLVLILMAIWGIFAVPNDPSRSGKAPIVTPGIIRLIIELGFFGFATWALYDIGSIKFAISLGGIVIVHYIVSYDRISWLMMN